MKDTDTESLNLSAAIVALCKNHEPHIAMTALSYSIAAMLVDMGAPPEALGPGMEIMDRQVRSVFAALRGS